MIPETSNTYNDTCQVTSLETTAKVHVLPALINTQILDLLVGVAFRGIQDAKNAK